MTPAERILVIDDDEDIRTVLQEVLAAAGYQVEVARDGAEALAKLPGAAPPLILLDMMMPNMDGETFLKTLRGTPHMQDALVVVVSGSAGVRQRASTLDVAGCLEKPFELDALMGVVSRLARKPLRGPH
jgi:CheY-like chemotaxis protein